MKFFFVIIFISLSSFAASIDPKFDLVDRIRSFDLDGKEYKLKFWSDARVFKVNQDSKFVACLENSMKANRPVALNFTDKSTNIEECKMYGTTLPGDKNSI